MLTHYAPDVETFLTKLVPAAGAAATDDSTAATADGQQAGSGAGGGAGANDAVGGAAWTPALEECVVIDFQKRLGRLQKRALAYRDLAPR